MARMVIVDTGVLVALLSRKDQHHEWAVRQAMALPLPWATCESVLSETYHRISPSTSARKGLLEMIRRGALAFPFALPPAMGSMAGLLEKFSDLPTSVADANLLLMAGHLPGAVIWTTDRDFLVYRWPGKKAPAVILPDGP
jgi:uncharacterized protein